MLSGYLALFAPQTASPQKTFRPRLEELETRLTPSGLGGITDPPGGATLSIGVDYGEGKTVTIFGWLQDAPDISGITVNIEGQVTATVTTNEYGLYTYTGEAADLGDVQASAPSVPVESGLLELISEAPIIDAFMAIEASNNFWTFSGHVDDESGEGLDVNLGGIPSLQGETTTVDGNGNFSLTIPLSGDPSDNGTVWAQTQDWWNLLSNLATDLVHQTGT
jgi:hypothetical protein